MTDDLPPTGFEEHEAGRSERRAKDALFEQFARLGNALSSPKRLELIDVLAQGERSVESLARATGLKLTTASAHLQALHHSGSIARRRDGTKIYYRLAGHDVARLYSTLCEVARAHLVQVDLAAKAYFGEDIVEEINSAELLRRIRAGHVEILDVRPDEEYAALHIRGAVSIPLENLPERLGQLSHDVDIVAYCRGRYCILSHHAVRLLKSTGQQAVRLAGGMLDWRLSGLPVESGMHASGWSGGSIKQTANLPTHFRRHIPSMDR
jgi:rhodanese-related sulfurtransferase